LIATWRKNRIRLRLLMKIKLRSLRLLKVYRLKLKTLLINRFSNQEVFLKKWLSKLIVMLKCLRTSRNVSRHVKATVK
jgi:hypothetical protein